jgi:hypothetical protein
LPTGALVSTLPPPAAVPEPAVEQPARRKTSAQATQQTAIELLVRALASCGWHRSVECSVVLTVLAFDGRSF